MMVVPARTFILGAKVMTNHRRTATICSKGWTYPDPDLSRQLRSFEFVTHGGNGRMTAPLRFRSDLEHPQQSTDSELLSSETGQG